jgi:uncharacterized iron-regulated membrane protein
MQVVQRGALHPNFTESTSIHIFAGLVCFWTLLTCFVLGLGWGMHEGIFHALHG